MHYDLILPSAQLWGTFVSADFTHSHEYLSFMYPLLNWLNNSLSSPATLEAFFTLSD